MGVTIATAFVVLCAVAAAATLWRVDDVLAMVPGGPQSGWRAGAPAADLAVLPVSAAAAASPLDSAKVASTLQPLLTDTALGSNVTAHVVDVQTGQALLNRNSSAPTTPASTIKLVTATSALATLGPGHRFTTRVVAGASPGEVVLVGGGDVTLAAGANGTYPDAARLTDLADQVKRSLGDTRPTKVSFDASIFNGPAVGPWDADIATNGVVAPITGLMTDGARVDPTDRDVQATRVEQPDLAAAQAFATLLQVPASGVARATAPQGTKELGVVQSAPLSRIVEFMLAISDNVIAESLARHVAIKRGQPPTFAGGAAAQRAAIGELGLPVAQLSMDDASGLSRSDRVSPSILTDVLTLAGRADRAGFRSILTGLAVSAYSGTLTTRFRKGATTAAAGVVRAKTGTLRSVSSLAGEVFTADGRQLVFAVLADNVPVGGTDRANDALDRIGAALAACGCR
jgi:D-alanyl-D-alanine carboxypeptidase/D-alanyl-D-alanine-endopeptidase (penicillin-binding protein 4)